jgi:hypothetical protein
MGGDGALRRPHRLAVQRGVTARDGLALSARC